MSTLTLTPNRTAKGAPIAARASGFPRYKMVRLIYGDVMTAPIKCTWSGVALATLTAEQTNMVYAESQTRGVWALATQAQMTVTAAPPPPPPPVDPPPTTGVPLTNAQTPNVGPPAVGSSIVEAGNRVWAICATQRHRYPMNCSWNADGSLILLDFTSGSAHLHSGTPPYAHLKQLQVPNEAVWSPTDPNLLYGSQGNALVKMDVRGGGFQTVRDFGAQVSIGRYEGGISDHGLIALDAGGRLRVWDTVTNREVSSTSMPSVDGYQISRTGAHVVIRGGNTRVLDADDLSAAPRVIDPLANHGCVTLFNGEDYYIGNNAVVGGTAKGTVAYRLSDGKPTVLIPRRNAFEDGHTGRGGMLSNYDATRHQGEPGRDQIVLPHLDGTVTPFGFAHHLTPDQYRNQPHASLDRTGKRALFFGWDSVACVVERP